MSDFNIIAELQIKGPTGLGQVQQSLQNALRGVKAGVEFTGAQEAVRVGRQLSETSQVLAGSFRTVSTESRTASQSVTGMSAALGTVPRQTGPLITGMAGASRAMRDMKSDADVASNALDRLGNQAGLSARRFVSWIATAGSLVVFTRAVKDGVSQAIEFETAINRIAQVSGKTNTELSNISGRIGQIATTLGVASKDLATAQLQFEKLGLSAKDSEDALNAVGKAALSVNFDGVRGASEAAVAALRQFKLEANELDSTLGSINAVANKFAVDANDITQAIKTAGSTFKQAGGDAKELISIFAAVKGTTEETAEGIAASLRLVVGRLQRADVGEGFKQLGINLRYTHDEAVRLGNVNLEAQFVGAYEAVRRLSEGLRGLPTTDPRYAAALEQLGGARQFSRVIPLIQQFGDAQRAMNAAQAGSVSTTLAAEKAQESLAVRMAQTREEFLQLIRSVVDSKGFQAFTDTALGLANAFIKVADTARPLIPLIAAVAAVKIGQALPTVIAGATRVLGGGGRGIGLATGGVVPGVGDTDSVPANLTPGEFVVRKQAARSIGYDRLHAMNQGGSLRRYAEGGDVDRYDLIHSSPVASELKRGGGWTSGMVAGILNGRHAENVLGAIPEGSTYLASGTEAIVLKTPDGNAVRVGKLVSRQNDPHNRSFLGRPKDPRYLQPISSQRFGRYLVETLPFVPSLDDQRRSIYGDPELKKQFNDLYNSFDQNEYRISDLHTGNIGEHNGQLVITDPNVVRRRKDLDRGLYAEGGDVAATVAAATVPYLDPVKRFTDKGRVVGTPAYISPEGAYGRISGGADTDLIGKYFQTLSGLEASNVGAFRKPTYRPGTTLSPNQAQKLLNIQPLLYRGFADGGSIDPFSTDYLNNVFSGFQNAYGVNLRKGFSELRLGRPGVVNYISGIPDTQGFMKSATGSLVLSKLTGNKPLDVTRTLVHEAVHGLDLLGGGGDKYLSREEGNPLNEVATYYRNAVVPHLANAYDPAYIKYISDPSESLAHAVHQGLYGDDVVNKAVPPKVLELLRKRVVGTALPYLAELSGEGKPGLRSLLPSPGLYDRVENAVIGRNVLPGEYAVGGSVDTVPAMLTPGEFVINKQAASQIGLAKLNQMNTTGRVHGYASGGPVYMAEGGEPPIGLGGRQLGEARVSKEFLDAMIERNFPEIIKAIARRAGTNRDVAAGAAGEAFQQGRLYKFKNNPETGTPFTEADVGHPELDKDFIFQVSRAAQTAIYRDNRKRNVQVPTDVQNSEVFQGLAAPAAGEETLPAVSQAKADLAASTVRSAADRLRARQATLAAQSAPVERRSAAQVADAGVGFTPPPPGPPAPPAAPEPEPNRFNGLSLPIVASPNNLRIAGLYPQDQGSTQTLPLSGLPGAAKAAGVDASDFSELVASVRHAATSSNKLSGVMDDSIQVLVQFKDGVAKFKGFVGQGSAYSFGGQPAEAGVPHGPPTPPIPFAGPETYNLLPPGVGSSYPPVTATKGPPQQYSNYAQPGLGQAFDPNRFDPYVGPIPFAGERPAGEIPLAGSPLGETYGVRGLVDNQTRRLQGQGLQFGSLRSLVAQRTTSEIGNRGGVDVLSVETKVGILNEQRAKTLQELIAAETRMVSALNPAVTAVEASKIAHERVNQALARNEQVVTSAAGPVGFANTVRSFDAQGLQVSDVQRPGLFGGIRNGFNRFSDFRNRAIANQGPGSQFGLFALSTAASFGAAGLESAAGSADTTSPGSFRAFRGGAGALGGAAAGATLGSFALPGVGTAIGAVVGGLTGLATSLNTAEKEIREVKIANALNDFSDKVREAARGGNADIAGDLSTLQKLNNQKNISEATGFFGFSGKDFDQITKRSDRQTFGPVAAALQEAVTKQISDSVKRNPNQSVDSVLGQIDKTLLSTLAKGSGRSPESLQQDLAKQIINAENSVNTERQRRTSITSEERTANAFGRLLTSIDASASALSDLHTKSQTLADAFNGTISSVRVQSHADNLSFLGRSPDALEGLQVVAAAGGEQGRRGLRLGQAANSVADVLRQVLPITTANASLTNSQELTIDTRNQALKALERQGVDTKNPEVQQVLNSAIHQLNELGKNGPQAIQEKVAIDTSKAVEDAMRPTTEALKVFSEAAQKLGQNANDFIDGLADLQHRLAVIGEGFDRINSARVATIRQQAEFTAQNNFSSRSVLDQLPLSLLNAPLQFRQERLTGLQGDAANDPTIISRRLAETNRQIEVATQRQQAAFDSTGGGRRGPEFKAATEELSRLQGQSANLTAALRHLTDVSERTAAAQERLREIDSDRRSRLGIAERFATAGPEEQLNLNRGLILANNANNNPGAFTHYTAEDRRTTLDFLRGAGDARLTGFKDSPVASDLAEKLLSGFGGGVFGLDQDRQKERGDLQQQVVADFARAAEAQKSLVDNQKTIFDSLAKTLDQRQEKFFAGLSKFFQNDQLTKASNDLSSTGQDLGRLRGLSRQRDILAAAGVTTDDQVANLRGNEGQVRALFAARQRVQEQFTNRDRVVGQVPGLVNDLFSDREDNASDLSRGFRFRHDQFVGGLTNAGLSGADASTVFKNVAGQLAEGGVGTKDALAEAVRKSVVEVTAQSAARVEKDALLPAQRNLAKSGLNASAIEDAARTAGGPDNFFKALNAFAGENTIGDLDDKIKKATASFDELTKKVHDLTNKQGAAPDAAAGFAGGGSIFQPRGSDTVPAMLTPGEFVVNAASARANASLLNRINSANGPAYLAGGGVADTDPDILDELARQVNEEGLAERKRGGVNLQDVRDFMVKRDAAKAPQAAARAPDNNDGEFLTRALRIQAGVNPYGASAGFLYQKRIEDVQATRHEKLNEQYQADLAAAEAGDEGAARRNAYRQQVNKYVRNTFGGRTGYEAAEIGQALYARRVQGAALNLGRRQSFAVSGGDLAGLGVSSIARQQEANDVATFSNPFARQARRAYVGPQQFATGGYVGTDTVPAMLTPGEFVLNTSATSRAGIGNLQHFNQGGYVGGNNYFTPSDYLAEGGDVKGGGSSIGLSEEVQQAFANFGTNTSALKDAFGVFGQSVGTLQQAFTAFGGNATALAEAISKMPSTLTVNGQQRVEVILNGAEMLARLTPEIQAMVEEKTQSAIQRVFKERLPDAGVVT